MKQKFPRGTIVKITKNLPISMKHFESDFVGVVEYTYAQRYGGSDKKQYSIIILNKHGKPINSISWYNENQLSLIDSNTTLGKSLIEVFYYGNN